MTYIPTWPDKDPDDVLDYDIDWSDWLADDTIATSTWTVPAGITKDSDEKSASATKIWLSGGTHGQTYQVLNRIVTTAGRTKDRGVKLQVRSA